MIKNTLLIINDQLDSIDNIKFSISWKLKSDLISVINTFIKSKQLLEFYPLSSINYVVTWNSTVDYNMFITHECYCSTIEFLKVKGIRIVWSEMEV